MDQPPPPDEVPSGKRSPDGDLALAFFGSIAVGLVTPVIPYLLLTWRPELLFLFAMLGGFLGFFWGYLTVIVAAAVACEFRRAATLWMLMLLSVGLLSICWINRHIADY